MALTPIERKLRASGAAYARWAKPHADPSAHGRYMHLRRLERIADEIDPDHQLAADVRARKAELEFKSRMRFVALASVRARRAKRQAPES